MSEQANQQQDCCSDHAKQCGKTGQQCQSASLLLMALSTAPALQLSRPPLTLSSVEVLPVPSTNGVWRPPRV